MAQIILGNNWTREMKNAIQSMFTELYGEYIGAGLDAKEAREKALQAVADSTLAKEDASVAKEMVQQIIDGAVDTGALNTNIEERLNQKEAEYAPRLNSLDQQLAQTQTELADITINVINPPHPLVGATGDGVTDDSQALYNIHDFANKNNYSVNYGNHSYFIGQCLDIPIRTNVDFGKSKIIVDESKALIGWSGHGYYRVEPSSELEDITSIVGVSLAVEWTKGASLLPSLAGYENSYVIVEDIDDILVRRSGSNQEYPKKDQTVISNSGKVLADLCFPFNKFTSVKVKPREDSYLEIKGGEVLFNGQRSEQVGASYRCPVFLIERCKVKLEFMTTDLLTGEDDLTGQATMGLFRTKNAEDVHVNNVKLLPRESSGMGTYGFVASETINLHLKNVEGDKENTWGVMQSDFLKNFFVCNSKLNRIDAHGWGYNFYINDTDVGRHGFTVFGGGDLFLDNVSSIDAQQFLNLRGDYGITWDGDLKIKKSKQFIVNRGQNRLINISLSSIHDFYRDLVAFNSIYIDDFEFVTNGIDQTIVGLLSNVVPNELNDFYLANDITMKNIKVSGREKGIIAFQLLNGQYINSKNPNGQSGDINTFKESAKIRLENINVKDMGNSFQVDGVSLGSSPYYPLITASDMTVRARIWETVAYLKAVNTDFQLSIYDANTQSILEVRDSSIKPVLSSTQAVFDPGLINNLGHFLLDNCQINLPIIDGLKDETLAGMERYNIFDQNKFNGWIKKCQFSREVVTSGVFVGKGQNGGMSHHAYVKSFEQASYSARNGGTIMPINDGAPMDGFFHVRGDIIWNEFGSSLGWKVLSSGVSSESRFGEIIIP